jgi:hypothetical protein
VRVHRERGKKHHYVVKGIVPAHPGGGPSPRKQVGTRQGGGARPLDWGGSPALYSGTAVSSTVENT